MKRAGNVKVLIQRQYKICNRSKLMKNIVIAIINEKILPMQLLRIKNIANAIISDENNCQCNCKLEVQALCQVRGATQSRIIVG